MTAIFTEKYKQSLANWMEDVLMTDTCDILRDIGTQRPSGGRDENWQPVNIKPIPCALIDEKRLPVEMDIAAQEQGQTRFRAYLPRGTDVRGTDRLHIPSGAVGITYHIVEPLDPSTLEISRRVVVRRSPIL
jgi:hypothetical protein